MRFQMLFSVALCLLPSAISPAGDDKTAQPSKDGYVKVRVEVEVRGILRVTEKAVTVTARQPVYELFDDAREVTSAASATSYTLEFTRAKDLRELARALDGKEVVATGMCELRMVAQPTRPGGVTGAGSPGPIPAPTWSLQRTVEVTGVKSATGK